MNFFSDFAKSYSFRFGLDAGMGGFILFDGTVVNFWNTDVWWEENWNNPAVK